jgi:hypothetical protein
MRTWLAASLALALSASCNTAGPSQSGAYRPIRMDAPALAQSLQTLKTQTYARKGKAADLEGVIAAVPAWLKVSHGAIGFDAASGATQVADLKVSLAVYPDAGVGVRALKLWGLDADFAKARLAGQRLGETARLANRLEADAVSVFGLDRLVNDAMAAGRKTAPATSDLDKALDVKLSSYDVAIGRVVISDLVLRPYVMEARTLAADNPAAGVFPLLQQASAIMRSIACDTLAQYDGKASFRYEQMGRTSAALVAFDVAGARGVRGGDTDVSLVSGIRYDVDMTDPTLDIPMQASGNIGRYSAQGLRLDKVLDHLARGVMPARSERDLMSLGVITSEDEAYSLNGAPVYAAKKSTIELNKWRWLIPTRVKLEVEDARYDIPSMIGMFVGLDPKLFGDPKNKAQMDGVMQTLAKYGLDKPVMDFTVGLDWNDETGGASMGVTFGMDQFMTFDLKLDGGLPDFDSVSALVPEDLRGAKTDEINKLFAARSTYKGLSVDLADDGGLDKLFGLTVDLAKLTPPDDTTFAMVRNSTPEGLRQMTSSLLVLASAGLAKEFPPAQPLLLTLASWIIQGGALHLRSQPPAPMGAEAFSAEASKDPLKLFDRLKVTLAHDKPVADKPPARPN